MKLSENFFYTLREDLKDEESISGNLLVKSGMFKKVGNGIYMKMPLGKKVAQNVEKIIRRYVLFVETILNELPESIKILNNI